VSEELVKLGIRVLLVEDSRVDALLIKNAVSKGGDARIELDHAQSLAEALTDLASERYDVILSDLMLPDSLGLDTIVRIHEAAPDIPIVVLTSIDDETMAIRAVQSGAQDYLVKGQLTPKQVLRSIRYAVARFDAQVTVPPAPSPGELGKVVALSGGKGGAGTTLIACHLAVDLQACTEKRVLLLDLDFMSGMTAFVMKVTSAYSALEVMQNIARLDVSFWKAVVVRGGHNIDILPALPTLPDKTPGPEAMRTFFGFLRANYDWTVVDLGHGLGSLGLSTGVFDRFFVVTTPELMSLYRTKQIVRSIAEAGSAAEEVGLVLNRSSKHTDFRSADIESLLGIPVSAILPDGTEEISEALASGRLVSQNSGFRRAVEAFAQRLVGVEQSSAPEQKRSLFGRLRLGRK
jgi:Flp pilus assembly CpaE family ATPase